MKRLLTLAGGLAALLLAGPAVAQSVPVEGDFTAPGFAPWVQTVQKEAA